MKRTKFVSLLTAACVMGAMVSACSDEKAVETTVTETTIVETTTTEEPLETKVSGPMKPGAEVIPLEPTEEVIETEVEGPLPGEPVRINDYLSYIKYEGDEVSELIPDAYYDEMLFYIPCLTFKGGDVDEINEQLLDFVTDSYYSCDIYRTDFKVFINDDNSISIVQFVYGVSDYLNINSVMVDLDTGKIISNEEILERAGVTEAELYDKTVATISNVLETYKADVGITDEIFDQMLESEFFAEAYELIYSPDTINKDMTMFIVPDGKLLVVSPILSFGSGTTTNEILDLDGNIWTVTGCGYMEYYIGDIVVYAREDGLILKK